MFLHRLDDRVKRLIVPDCGTKALILDLIISIVARSISFDPLLITSLPRLVLHGWDAVESTAFLRRW